MTVLSLAQFSGEVPKVNPRLLANGGAQAAFNVRLDDGGLTPMRWARFAYHFPTGSAYQTIFKDGDTWMGWDKPVNVVRGPVANNRLYITGDGAPKLMIDGQTYPLALAFPTAAPVATLTAGTVDDDLSSTVVYAYTWVTQFDEESEPSQLSNEVLWSPGCTITLTGFGIPPAGRAVNRMRIYRAQTATGGNTGLFFLAERDVSTAPYVDAYGELNEAIPSVSYNAPPDDLTGIIALPNGMMAAFVGKTLCFCEPFLPHAWPEKYQLQTDFPIVGLGAFGSSLVVTTTGNPYVVTGTAPENMTMERLEVNLPCINPRSIVDLGYSIAYASHQGLVVVSSAGASVATSQVIARDDWMMMSPGTMVAAQYDGRYMAAYAYVDTTGVQQRGIMILDMTGQQPFIIRGTDDANALFYELETGSLYLLRNGADVYQWDDISQPPGEMYWRSKQFIYGGPMSFGCLLVEGFDTISDERRLMFEARMRERIEAVKAANQAAFEAEDIKGAIAEAPVGVITFAGSLMFPLQTIEPYCTVTIWADGKKLFTTDKVNQVVRLPARLASWWEVEVRSNMQLSAIRVAQSPDELTA